jgi:hypothetical protein
VLFTYDNLKSTDSIVQIYINGVKVIEGYFPLAVYKNSKNAKGALGAKLQGTATPRNYLKGYISDFRIYQGVLNTAFVHGSIV